jgi:hypothetical protein
MELKKVLIVSLTLFSLMGCNNKAPVGLDDLQIRDCAETAGLARQAAQNRDAGTPISSLIDGVVRNFPGDSSVRGKTVIAMVRAITPILA